jgi:hypothetical protein
MSIYNLLKGQDIKSTSCFENDTLFALKKDIHQLSIFLTFKCENLV